MAKKITQRTLVGFRKAKVNTRYFEDLINQIKNKQEHFIEQVGKFLAAKTGINDMKFTAVVGNPPYQKEEIDNNRKSPLYHLFYDAAFKLAPIVTLITPGRYLFKVGMTPKEWMSQMLSDPHFRVVDYFPESNVVFPTVLISGGIAIGLRNKFTEFGAIGAFAKYPELMGILHKVTCHHLFKHGEFAEIVSSQGIYHFSEYALKSVPRIIEVQGKGTATKITSKAFENLPEIFVQSEQECGGHGVQILGRIQGSRQIKWIDVQYLQDCEYLNYYNVIVPESNGSGMLNTPVIGVPVIGEPALGHADTFLSIGKFASEQEATACFKYIKSKFARCMLGTLKATHHNPKSTWANVPMQNFTKSSDIDWSKSIPEIDAQLYKKYNLSQEEVNFIESKVQPM